MNSLIFIVHDKPEFQEKRNKKASKKAKKGTKIKH
jgi:hypothetical protein